MQESVWLVPAAVAIVRIGLDPMDFAYYWDVPMVLFLIGASGLLAGRAELKTRLSTAVGSDPSIGDQVPAPRCR